MYSMSLLDTQSDQPEDHIMATHTESNDAALNDLTLTVKVIESNYATKEALANLSGTTKEALAVLSGKIDLLASAQQALHAHAMQSQQTLHDHVMQSQQTFQDHVMQSQQTLHAQAMQSQQAFQTQAFQTFATKADLANMMYQLTWRMTGFTAVMISTIIAAARYL